MRVNVGQTRTSSAGRHAAHGVSLRTFTGAADLLPQFETVFTASSGGGVVEHQRGKSADRSGAVDLLQSAARSMVDDVEDDVTAMHSAGKPTATQGPSSTQTTPQFDSSALGTSA